MVCPFVGHPYLTGSPIHVLSISMGFEYEIGVTYCKNAIQKRRFAPVLGRHFVEN